MPTIDELGRRAGAAVRRDAAIAVDVEAGLGRLRAGEPPREPRRASRRVPVLIAAAAAVVLLVAGLVVVTLNRPGDTGPAATTPPTSVAPATTVAPTTPTVAPSTTVPPGTGGNLPYNPDLLTVDLPARTEPLALPPCQYPACPTFATTADGRLVSFDAANRTFTIGLESGDPTFVVLAEPLAASWLVTIGPDDVAYVGIDVAGDPLLVVVAVPLAGPRAGEVVATSGEMDGSGDTDLVPTGQGLVGVSCCGGDGPRPAHDASLLVGWVDRDGNPISADGPQVSVELVAGRMAGVLTDGGTVWVRREIAADVGPVRGMPRTAITGPDSFLLTWDDLDLNTWLVSVRGDGPVQHIVVPDGVRIAHLDRFGAVVFDGSSMQRWMLPAYADASEATRQAIDLAGSDRFADLDALGQALVAALTAPDACEVAPTAEYGVAPVSRADVPVVVEYRTGCDDSIAGGRFEVRATLTDGMWVVVSADHRSLCSRGADGTLCV